LADADEPSADEDSVPVVPECVQIEELRGKNKVELFGLQSLGPDAADIGIMNREYSIDSVKFIENLKKQGTQVYYEATEKDVIAPYPLQLRYGFDLWNAGIKMKAAIAMRSGHQPIALQSPRFGWAGYRFHEMIKLAVDKMTAPEFDYDAVPESYDFLDDGRATLTYYNLNRETNVQEEFTPHEGTVHAGGLPFTADLPYVVYGGFDTMFVFTGIYGTKYKLAVVIEATGELVPLTEGEIGDHEVRDGQYADVATSIRTFAVPEVPVELSYIYHLQILKPGSDPETGWELISNTNTTTGAKATVKIIPEEPDFLDEASKQFMPPALDGFKSTNWGLSEY